MVRKCDLAVYNKKPPVEFHEGEVRRRADANHSSHRLNQGLNECSYVQKRLGNMPDHCTLEYKLAVDFSCQQISGSGGRYYFPLIFAHFFIKKYF